MLKKLVIVSGNKISVFVLVLALIVGGVGAQATGLLNTQSGGILFCFNPSTKAVTHPGTSSCPKGSKKLVLGAQGEPGTAGLTGAAGLPGKDGRNGSDGKTLWNGVTDPAGTWGAQGDMFINSTTQTLFGPKNINGIWPAGVSMVGPKGDQGLTGLIGLTGAQGPVGLTGAQGLIGLTGAQGPVGSTGAQGPQGPGGGSGPAGPQGSTGTTGAAGAAGTNGATGPAGAAGTNGATFVYQKKHNYDALTTTVANVVSLSLPAGSYIVTYTGLGFKGNAGSEYLASRIAITSPGNLGGQDAIMLTGGTNDGRAYVAHQLAITLATAGSVSVFANTLYGTAGETALSNGTLTAVQVSDVNNQ